nr:hypothetical protein [Spirosomataceae bacterium]
MAAAGTYTVTVTNASGCSASATTAVMVSQAVTALVTPTTQTICSGSAITTMAITGTATSYTWTRDNTTAVTGIASSGSGDISGSLTNTTNAPVTVTFTVTPVGACSGTPITATVVVNPIPTVTASTPSQSICSGQNITGISFNPSPSQPQQFVQDSGSDISIPVQEEGGIALSSTVAGTVFTWTRDNTSTVTGTIGSGGSGNISGSLINTTTSPITVTFTITPSYTNAGQLCTGTPITVTVTVNPNPAPFTMTDTGTTLCQGSSTTLSAPANPNYTYAWQRSLTGIANPNSFTTFGGTAQTQEVTTSSVYRVVVTNQYNCSATDTTAVRIADFIFDGSLAAGDAQQTGRMNRFGVNSTCATPKNYPGDFSTSGARYYDSYTITNPRNVPVCAMIGIRSGCGVNIFSAAYSGSFNPTAMGTNYLADPGSSFPSTGFYSATVPANGTIVVVVHEVNTGTGCAGYSLSVELPREAAGITVSPSSPICAAGTPVSLTASVANSYLWSPGGATTQSINPSPTATTTYSVTLGYGNANCSTTATAEVTINPLPIPNPTSDSPKCVGTTLSFNSVSGMTSYVWSGPNSFTSSLQTPSISNVTTAANGVYTLTVTNSNGCSASATTSVTINPLPVPAPTNDS